MSVPGALHPPRRHLKLPVDLSRR